MPYFLRQDKKKKEFICRCMILLEQGKERIKDKNVEAFGYV